MATKCLKPIFQPKQSKKVGTPYLTMVRDTMSDVLAMDRPLTVDKLADYVNNWYQEQWDKRLYITRSGYNTMLRRKTNATVRVVKSIGLNTDSMLEIILRQRISERVLK